LVESYSPTETAVRLPDPPGADRRPPKARPASRATWPQPAAQPLWNACAFRRRSQPAQPAHIVSDLAQTCRLPRRWKAQQGDGAHQRPHPSDPQAASACTG